jgi:hypothetical protein
VIVATALIAVLVANFFARYRIRWVKAVSA